MPVRNRVIYQSQAVYVSQDVNCTGIATGTTDNVDLNRIQSCNYSFNISRQDVNQFGELGAIDRIITDTPTVSLDGSYMVANLGNEAKLGFNVWAGPTTATNSIVSCISGIVNSETNDGVKNYYIVTTAEGSDAIENTVSGKYESIVGIGNASLTSYSTEGAVGGLPTASFSVEGQNMNVVHTPYTGMYEGYTGPNFYPLTVDGYGYRTAGQVVFTVTGAATAEPVEEGSSRTVEITSGVFVGALGVTRTGIAATIPSSKVFTHDDTGSDEKTITLSNMVEKGAQQVVGTVAGDDLVTGDTFTGTFNDVVAYISGSNPSIDPTLGEQPVWAPTSGGTALTAPAGTKSPVAPVILPVPTTNLNPSDVNPSGSISTLRPGDITLTLEQSPPVAPSFSAWAGVPGASITNAHIQSYTISFDLSRTPIQKLGSRFAFVRPIDFPISASFSFDAILSDLTTGNIGDIIDCDTNYDARVSLKNTPDCNAPTVKDEIIVYDLKGLKLDSQSFSSSVGDNKTVTFDFTCQVGGPEQTDVGVFMSGYSTELAQQ